MKDNWDKTTGKKVVLQCMKCRKVFHRDNVANRSADEIKMALDINKQDRTTKILDFPTGWACCPVRHRDKEDDVIPTQIRVYERPDRKVADKNAGITTI